MLRAIALNLVSHALWAALGVAIAVAAAARPARPPVPVRLVGYLAVMAAGSIGAILLLGGGMAFRSGPHIFLLFPAVLVGYGAILVGYTWYGIRLARRRRHLLAVALAPVPLIPIYTGHAYVELARQLIAFLLGVIVVAVLYAVLHAPGQVRSVARRGPQPR